jgi:hypothetical protein
MLLGEASREAPAQAELRPTCAGARASMREHRLCFEERNGKLTVRFWRRFNFSGSPLPRVDGLPGVEIH